MIRGNCKTPRRAKSPFCRLLPRRRLVYSPEYVRAAAARTGEAGSGKRRQNHRFFAGGEFCNYLFLLLLLLCGCQQQPIGESFHGHAMTMEYKIIIGSPLSTTQRARIETIIADTFAEIDTIYNKWNPHSELSAINRHAGSIPIPLSQKLEALLLLTNKIVLLSEGRFDPTIEAVQSLWKSHFAKGTLPEADAINALRPITGWDKIQLSPGTLTKAANGVQLDLGGIAKGLGVDLLVENLNDAGFENLFVEWGGEIRTTGKHPEERPWRIFISRLENRDPDQAIAHLDLQDQAIATSGDYLQYWETEAGTFFHIIDPRTLQPLQVHENSIASASVLAKQCALADGLATAAMLFPTVVESQAWAEKLRESEPDLAFWIISRTKR